MNVLSLFDGISCGRLALERAGIKVDNYFSSEIDKYTISVSKYNYKDIIQLGNIIEISKKELENLPKIDLLIGGSPCQDLSVVNSYSDKKGLFGKKSSLFWEYSRILHILKEINPNILFLFENVGSAKITDRKIISCALETEGKAFNSNLLSAQNRNRIYWTNIPFTVPSKRKNLFMKDILEKSVSDKYYLSEKMKKYIFSCGTKTWVTGKLEINQPIARTLTATMHKMHRADTDNYISTDYSPINKTNIRKLTPIECERLQTLPDNYTLKGINEKNKEFTICDTRRYMAIGNGWTVDVIAHILKNLKEVEHNE